MATFSLATAPWIPVIDHAEGTGRSRDVGIGEALSRAHELGLAASGHEHAVLLRLLLAVYAAAAGPADWDQWARAWHAPALDAALIGSYLGEWAGSLDLYDPLRPAFQAGGITAFPRPHSTLHHEYLGGAAGEWFNRGLLASPDPVRPGVAARALLSRVGYDVAGIKGGIGGGRTYGAWLGHLGAVTHMSVDGPALSLKDEILLNLPPRPRDGGDRPAWEAGDLPLTPGATRPVAGRLDWWTWPSRIIRLHPDASGAVTGIAWHDGLRPDGGTLDAARAHDPMTAWKPTGGRLTIPVEWPLLPAWFGGLAAAGGCGAIDNAAEAAARRILPPGYQLRLRVAWTDYNDHKTVIQNSGRGTVRVGPASVLADPAARQLLAVASRFPSRVPAAIRHIAGSSEHPASMIARGLVLDDLGGAWGQLLGQLEAGNTAEAARLWSAAVLDAALDLFDRQVAARSVMVKERARENLSRYLHGMSRDLHAISAAGTAGLPAALAEAPGGGPRS